MDDDQKEQNQLNNVYFILSGEFAAYQKLEVENKAQNAFVAQKEQNKHFLNQQLLNNY